jgi:hypothetical protein
VATFNQWLISRVVMSKGVGRPTRSTQGGLEIKIHAPSPLFAMSALKVAIERIELYPWLSTIP